MPAAIRAIFSDIEGCIVPGAGRPWELDVLTALAAYVGASARDPQRFPPLVLCTGRPAPYVEALGHALGLRTPAICENGAVLCDLETGAVEDWSPAHARPALEAARRVLEAEWCPRTGTRMVQGKRVCISLSPPAADRPRIAELARDVARHLARAGVPVDRLHLTHSYGAIDITPAGVTKASGARRLCARWECGLDAVLAIGDSANDLELLTAAGRSAAPANALDAVAGVVSYRSPLEYGAGVLDILGRFTGFDPTGRPEAAG